MLLNCGVGEDSWEYLGLQGDPLAHLKEDESQVFIGRTDVEAETPILCTWCEELTHLKRPWWWERLRAGGEGDDRGWDGWMASPSRWTWVWVNSRSWWWTGRPGMLWFMGSQRVGHDWATEVNWTELNQYLPFGFFSCKILPLAKCSRLGLPSAHFLQVLFCTGPFKIYGLPWIVSHFSFPLFLLTYRGYI